MCFLDAYSEYHQIAMKEFDKLMTSFITVFGLFCYMTMLFELKNAGATYQRSMLRCFGTQVRSNIQVYGDNIFIKCKKVDDLVTDLEETFTNLHRFNIKLNPGKCVFGVRKSKLLGFIVSERAIEANKEKITVILMMEPIHNLKGVQNLTGCLAALGASSSLDFEEI
jgi:hypothetical protein